MAKGPKVYKRTKEQPASNARGSGHTEGDKAIDIGSTAVEVEPLAEALASWSLVLNTQVRERTIFRAGGTAAHTFLITNKGPSGVLILTTGLAGGPGLRSGETVVLSANMRSNTVVRLVGVGATVNVSLLAVVPS